MGALAVQSPWVIFILAIELQMIYIWILFAADVCFFHLLIETNSYEVVMMINSWEIMWANVSNTVDDVRGLLMQFSLKEVKFQPSMHNKVAHAIACIAYRNNVHIIS